MAIPNAGYLFYKKYFDQDKPGIVDTTVNEKIERIPALPLDAEGIFRKSKGFENFPLTTSNPGLVAGTGYSHDVKGKDDAYKIGFFFDHTTGMPVIPGSSVKGSLRSLFPNKYREPKVKEASSEKEKEKEKLAEWKDYSELRYPLIRNLVQKICQLELDNEQINLLETDIFGDPEGKGSRSPYKSDIFLDAFPVKVVEANLGDQKRLFGSDYLTPHLNRDRPELSPFTNPVPLKFLKVMPGVQFEFRFILRDSTLTKEKGEEKDREKGPTISADQKRKLFEALLQFKGVGAKTNVGYGQFQEESSLFEIETIGPSGETSTTSSAPKEKRTEPENYTGRIKNGEGPLEAKVMDPDRKIVRIMVNGVIWDVRMTGNCPHEAGDLINVVLNQVDKKYNRIKEVGYRGPVRQ